MTRLHLILINALISVLFWCNQAFADTHSCSGTVSSCQSAVNVASDGDIISIPQGSFTWSSGLSWTDKNITLQGAGIGNTTITNGIHNGMIVVYADTKPFRITGMTINNSGGGAGWIGIYQTCNLSPSCTPTMVNGWRIDHIRFNQSGVGSSYAILADGQFKGLIDNNYFYNNGGTFIGMRHISKGGTSDIGGLTGQWGELAWKRPTRMGTDDAIFMEDNTVEKISGYTTINDGSGGSRLVIRYNTFIGENLGIQIHATGNPGRGAVFTEIYNNSWITQNYTNNIGIIRSGTGVIYNNTVVGTPNFLIDDQRTCSAIMYPRCDGTYANDGNTAGEMGWPCMDQIGRGAGDGEPGTNNISEPLYVWNNGTMVFGLNAGVSCSSPSQGDHIKTYGDLPTHAGEVVDYVVGYPKPGYTPYTYPHPLAGGTPSPSDTTPPSAPTGVTVI